MEQLQPLGRSQMSGTYLAHPTAVLAALAALEEYSRPGFYEQLDALCDAFYAGFRQAIDRSGVRLRLQHAGPRFGLYFGVSGDIVEYRKAATKNHEAERIFVRACHERGVYFQPAAHHGFSAVHTQSDLQMALEVIEAALFDVRAATVAA